VIGCCLTLLSASLFFDIWAVIGTTSISTNLHLSVFFPCVCRYVIGTLELLVAENYMIVYLNGATTRRKMPSIGWLRKCYQQIDRR